MEQIEVGGNRKEKMAPNMDSSSKHAENFQAEKHDMDLNVEQNLMDPNSRRIFSNQPSVKRSRKKKMKFVKNLEDRTKILQDQVAQLQPQQDWHQNQVHRFMVEEEALLQEMENLRKKALLRDAEDEKNRSRMNTLRELQEKKQEQLLNFNIDPLDPVFNDTPSFQVGGSGSESS